MKKKQTDVQKDLDFEIQFIENILKEKPDFIEGLVALGDAYTKKGLFEKGLEIDLKLADLRPFDSTILYNLACSYSLVKRIDDAFTTLELAVKTGYDHFEFLHADRDLSNIREDSRYPEFIRDMVRKRMKTDKKDERAER